MRSKKTELLIDFGEERIIGTLLGKNLYEKTIHVEHFTIDANGNLSVFSIPHNIKNLAMVISIDAIGGIYILPYFSGGSVQTYVNTVDDTNINIASYVTWNDYIFNFVIRYLKKDG